MWGTIISLWLYNDPIRWRLLSFYIWRKWAQRASPLVNINGIVFTINKRAELTKTTAF